MQYAQFLTLISQFGDSSISAEKRWRSISFILSKSLNVINLKDYYIQNRFYFIGTGQTDELTGFLLIDVNPKEFDVNNKVNITFIPLSDIRGVGFYNDEYESIVQLDSPVLILTDAEGSDNDTLSWDAITDATGYDMYKDGVHWLYIDTDGTIHS